jgi:hypothetical protein
MDYNRQVYRKQLIIEKLLCDIYDHIGIQKTICPICMSEIRLYTPAGLIPRGGARCPVCKTLERQRLLWLYFERFVMGGGGGEILHFAPEKGFYDYFVNNSKVDYYPVDINPERYQNLRSVEDITKISYGNDMFDMPTLENPEYNTPELRERYYGQNDHVRYYGNDFADRLSLFNVEVVSPKDLCSAEEIQYYSLVEDERIYVCRK